MSARPALSPVALAVLAGFAVAHGGALLSLWAQGGWVLDLRGAPLAVDFVLFRAAGGLAAEGAAASAYDPVALKAAEAALVGRDFAGHYGWHYPPTFLLAAAPLAPLAFVQAELAWIGVTGAAYLLVARLIAGWGGVLAALAVPPLLACVVVGQTGCLVAALFGAALLALPRRPTLAGCLFGCLAAKPHLAFLVPLALLAGGHLRALAAAGAAAAGTALLSLALFGPEPWAAFLRDLPEAGASLLGEGVMGFAKLQSAFGAARVLGAGPAGAWAAQALSSGLAALGTWILWRSSAPARLKAAGLMAAALLATPYLYLYDLVLLAPAIAFLLRGPLRPADLALVAAALGAAALGPIAGAPAGLAASILVAAAVARDAAPFLRRETGIAPSQDACGAAG